MPLKGQVTIRRAREDELPRIRELSIDELPAELNEQETVRMEESRAAFGQRLDALFKKEGNEFFVAELEGEPGIAGYIWLGVSDRPFSELKVGWIYDILVVPDHRGQGVGRALMEHALEAAAKRGFGQTGLMVRANNRTAYSLYEKLGYRPEYVVMTRDQKATSRYKS